MFIWKYNHCRIIRNFEMEWHSLWNLALKTHGTKYQYSVNFSQGQHSSDHESIYSKISESMCWSPRILSGLTMFPYPRGADGRMNGLWKAAVWHQLGDTTCRCWNSVLQDVLCALSQGRCCRGSRHQVWLLWLLHLRTPLLVFASLLFDFELIPLQLQVARVTSVIFN